MKLRRDDVALGHEKAGAGDPPLVLIHGWGGTHRAVFGPLIRATFEGHRVVAVDLRGHGESDAAMQDYSVEAFADDVVGSFRSLACTGPSSSATAWAGSWLWRSHRASRYAQPSFSSVTLPLPQRWQSTRGVGYRHRGDLPLGPRRPLTRARSRVRPRVPRTAVPTSLKEYARYCAPNAHPRR
jgi:hypothetical protein